MSLQGKFLSFGGGFNFLGQQKGICGWVSSNFAAEWTCRESVGSITLWVASDATNNFNTA